MRAVVRPSFDSLMFVAAFALVVGGLASPTARYLSPQSGLGYALGIIGGSMMLLLIVYPLRKRIRALSFLGGVPQWFRLHMLLGIGGPICILFHSNFSLGATNSNVALFSMLIVSGSGIAGRYFYTKIHHGLYGRKSTLAELQARAESLKGTETQLAMLPHMLSRLELIEQQLIDTGRPGALTPWAPLLLAARAARGRRGLRRYVHTAVREAAAGSPTIAAQGARIERVAMQYAQRRILASRQVAEFRIYERLFSWWHVLHLPLFFMLLAAGIVHVIAVNVY